MVLNNKIYLSKGQFIRLALLGLNLGYPKNRERSQRTLPFFSDRYPCFMEPDERKSSKYLPVIYVQFDKALVIFNNINTLKQKFLKNWKTLGIQL